MRWLQMTAGNCVICTAPCLTVIRRRKQGGAAKKMMKLQEDSYLEYAKSVAIRMFPISSTLGIAEGDRNGSGLPPDHEVQHVGDDEYRLHEEIPRSLPG